MLSSESASFTVLTLLSGDPLEQLVRHFLIETGPRGVKIKGCQNESYFGQLCGRHNCRNTFPQSHGWRTEHDCFNLLAYRKRFCFVRVMIRLTYFVFLSVSGSLSALVYQHSITPISLPCALRVPEKGRIPIPLQRMGGPYNIYRLHSH